MPCYLFEIVASLQCPSHPPHDCDDLPCEALLRAPRSSRDAQVRAAQAIQAELDAASAAYRRLGRAPSDDGSAAVPSDGSIEQNGHHTEQEEEQHQQEEKHEQEQVPAPVVLVQEQSNEDEVQKQEEADKEEKAEERATVASGGESEGAAPSIPSVDVLRAVRAARAQPGSQAEPWSMHV